MLVCNRMDCVNNVGRWVNFATPWGQHRGIVSDVNQHAVLIRVPRQYAPMALASAGGGDDITADDDTQKLDAVLAGWGYPGYGAYGPGPYGPRWGYPGYGAWYGGWWWWWLAFAAIFALAFLW